VSDDVLAKASSQVAAAQDNVPIIRAFFDEDTFTVSYVIHDGETRVGAIIDSVLDYDPASGRTSTTSADEILAYIREQGIAVQWLLETHAHADHLTAAPYLQQKLGAPIAIGEHIVTVQETFGKLFNVGSEFRRDGSDFGKLFSDGEQFQIGNLDVTVMHVPCHTPACVAYVV
jgi:glyoxylase-like metal-dependent hydrolase (beta-lactamase superfamily II)